MDTGTPTARPPSWPDYLGPPCLWNRTYVIIIAGLLLYPDVLAVYSLVLLSAAREFRSLPPEMAMHGTMPDSSSAVLPLYLGPVITLRSSPSGNWKSPSVSIRRTRGSRGKWACHWSYPATSTIPNRRTAKCRPSAVRG